MTALLLVPTALDAEELQFGVRSNVHWGDNVDGVPEDADEDPVDDASIRLSPSVEVRDRGGELTWWLRYQPSYERYLDRSEINGFDQDASGGLSWRFADRWIFALQESYVLNQSSVRFNEAADPGEEVTLGFRDQEVRQNRTSASLTHTLSPLDSLSLTLNYNNYEYPDTSRSDRSTPSMALTYDHTFSERTTAGLRFSWTQQADDGNLEGDDETAFYNLSGTLRYRISPTFRLEASAGPALVDSSPGSNLRETFQFPAVNTQLPDFLADPNDPDPFHGPFALDADQCKVNNVPGRASTTSFLRDCGFPQSFFVVTGDPPMVTFPTEITRDEFDTLSEFSTQVPTLDEQGNLFDESTGTDLTYFASLMLVKDWEYWSGILGYRRSNSESSRLGSSSIADSLWATLTWNPRQFWTLSLTASVSLQEQASDQGTPVAFQLANVPPPAGVTTVTQVAQVTGIILSDSDVEYRTQSLALRATRRLTQHASAHAAVNWNSQQQEVGSPFDQTTRWNNLTLSVGLEWQFDPIQF